MNYYKIKYANGKQIVVKSNSVLDIIRKYDLATRENIQTRVVRLEG